MPYKKTVLEGRCPIKRCILAIGYYALYQDLSKSKKESKWVRKVYEPLWRDTHHLSPSEQTWDRLSEVSFDCERYQKEIMSAFCEDWLKKVIAESGPDILGGLLQRVETTPWLHLSTEQKYEGARARAEQHNRLYAYKGTREENKQILFEMIEFMSSHQIIPVVVFSRSPACIVLF